MHRPIWRKRDGQYFQIDLSSISWAKFGDFGHIALEYLYIFSYRFNLSSLPLLPLPSPRPSQLKKPSFSTSCLNRSFQSRWFLFPTNLPTNLLSIFTFWIVECCSNPFILIFLPPITTCSKMPYFSEEPKEMDRTRGRLTTQYCQVESASPLEAANILVLFKLWLVKI